MKPVYLRRGGTIAWDRIVKHATREAWERIALPLRDYLDDYILHVQFSVQEQIRIRIENNGN